MNDNPFASPESVPARPRHDQRNLMWHALFNPFHPISYGPPLLLVLLIACVGLIVFLVR